MEFREDAVRITRPGDLTRRRSLVISVCARQAAPSQCGGWHGSGTRGAEARGCGMRCSGMRSLEPKHAILRRIKIQLGRGGRPD